MDDNWEMGISSRASEPPPCESHGGDAEEGEEEEEEEEEYGDDVDDDCDDDENEGVYDEKSGLACPFCSEDFDVLELCCHIDLEHHKEAKAEICPVCFVKVETNMAVHLITQHETILKVLCKKKFCNGRSRSGLSFLKKDLLDELLHTPFRGSSPVNSNASVEPDSLLLEFFYSPQPFQKPEIANPSSEASLIRNSSHDCNSERDVKTPAFPDKNEEKAKRCEFVCGLLFSMILSDDF